MATRTRAARSAAPRLVLDEHELPILRTSSRLSFRRCPQQWEWGINQGLEPMHQGLGALWFGTGIHIALAEWYLPGKKRGTHPAKTWQKYCQDEYNWVRTGEWGTPEEEFVNARDLGTAMMENYVDHWGRDRSWRVIQPERTALVRVPHPLIRGQYIVTYALTADLVYFDENDGIIKLGEHKTAAQIVTRHLTLDDQAGAYPPFMTIILRNEGLLKPNERIEEITYNFMRKALKAEDDRPKNRDGLYLNKDGSVSKKQAAQAPLFVRVPVERTAAERSMQIERIQAEALAMEAFWRGDLPIYKNTNRDCSYCPFFEMCELHEAGGDWETLREATMRRRDPNAPYRKAA